MRPLPGESVTYIDENGKKFVAKVIESFKDESKKHGLVSIEYKREDRSTGRVSAICHIEDQYETSTGQKLVCYTSEKPKSDKHKSEKKSGGTKPSTETSGTDTTASLPATTASSVDAIEMDVIPGPISDEELVTA